MWEGHKLIEVKNLTKKYGNHLAVDNLSFTVEKGMIYGFLGPNGAGKSTTMNIMTGYIAATKGTVTINGYDILKESEKAKKCIGYLPELPPVYPDMTVLEYLKFVAELKQVKKSEQKEQINSIMEQTQIADVKNRLIRNLSKGYKQRVGLAQAIVGYPEVIILDEPTVGLDPKQIIEIRMLIKNLAQNHTIILSSHILSEVSAVCDHIMIISKGKLVASDTPDKLMELMKGETVLELTVLGEEDKLKGTLENIEGVDKFDINIGKNQGEICAKIHVSADKDIRKELFYRLASSDMPIMQLRTDEKSLEEVFLELTGDNETPDNETPDNETPMEVVTTEETTAPNESDQQEVTENDSDI
jgi:ABC-2 type transport system ATP-binding protein